MDNIEIIGYTKSGKAIAGKDENGWHIYLIECCICQKKFTSLSTSTKFCCDECRNKNKEEKAKQESEEREQKYKEKRDKLLQHRLDLVQQKMKKTEQKNLTKINIEKNISIDNNNVELFNSINKNKSIITTDKPINNKTEAEKLIVKYINKYNDFPHMNEYISCSTDGTYVLFKDLIKTYFHNKPKMKRDLKQRYKNGEFKITSNCLTCDKEIDITYSSKKHCSIECQGSEDKFLLQCVECGNNFYSSDIKDRCCGDECDRKYSIKSHQINLCNLGHKIVKKCGTCGRDFITTSYNAVNCDDCRIKNAEYQKEIYGEINNSRWKMQDKMYRIICDLLPAYLIENDKFYSFIDGLQLDVYIPDLNLAFEYDGEQHYHHIEYFHKTVQEFEEQQKRDKWKNTMCKKNNITLIRIKYDEYLSWKLILYKLVDNSRLDIINKIYDSTTIGEIVEYIDNSFHI